MGQPKCFADLALGQRRAACHQVGVNAGDGGGNAPGRAHLAPGIGEPQANGLGRG